jgi:hypothetical protein
MRLMKSVERAFEVLFTMAESIRKMLHNQRVTGDKGVNAGETGSTSEGTGVPGDDGTFDAVHMKAEALAHLALSVVFLSAYREILAKESTGGAGLRPLLNQLSLDVAKVAAALEGIESMATGLAKNDGV